MTTNELKIKLRDCFDLSALKRMRKTFPEKVEWIKIIDRDIKRLESKGAYEVDLSQTTDTICKNILNARK